MRASIVLGLATLSILTGCASRAHFNLTVPSSGVHRLADGGCVDFNRLPLGWRAALQPPVHEAAAIMGAVQGIPVRAAIHTGGLYTDVYGPTVIGWRRLPSDDVQGFTAWMADDGELVLADGDRKTYRVIVECEPESTRLRTPATCHVSDHHLGNGRLLEVEFGWSNLKRASLLIEGAEAAAARLPHACPA